ncbi:hypothetical protein [Serinibacter salmoneus]|uniref:Uncharacterized protein n=1 Tax=Serinibacter salmoneus TaxID=556530 RepID=A0A2A9CZI6_9MICO|nr:hypothetical protein [Serinibacter salmoneus]PFG19847.1 hypothetical protein ATL40_1423 [Serinibacter salmoneus]
MSSLDRVAALQQETILAAPGAWVPEFSLTVRECACVRYPACPPCARGDGHRECWGMSFRDRWGPEFVSIHDGAAGKVHGLAAALLLHVYEAGYPHRSMCDCHDHQHPGAGQMDSPAGRADRRWAIRIGLPVGDVQFDPDETGTPSLLGALA